MEALLGTTIPVFVGVTVILFGGAAAMMGRAVGGTWRPPWQCVFYGLMLGITDRFVIYALFDGDGLSISGLIIDGAIIIGFALFAHRVTLVHRMVAQYPWLFERAGPLSWRPKG